MQAGDADGLSYVLTEQDGLAALDLDNCRNADTGSVDVWAQWLLEQALDTYCEITPSGCGLRIWGTANGNALHRKFNLSDSAALELFRRTHKALTISGLDLRQGRSFGSIDTLLDYAVFYGEKHKPAPPVVTAVHYVGNGSGLPFSIEQIELAVSSGTLPIGANRSNLFHAIVGHYFGCGWSAEQIVAHMEQFPDGVGGRYLCENRLATEVMRSFSKYQTRQADEQLAKSSPWSGVWSARSQQNNDRDKAEPAAAFRRRIWTKSWRRSCWSNSRQRICHRCSVTAMPTSGRSKIG